MKVLLPGVASGFLQGGETSLLPPGCLSLFPEAICNSVGVSSDVGLLVVGFRQSAILPCHGCSAALIFRMKDMDAVKNIFSARHVLQIVPGIVGPYAIFMIDFLAWRAEAKKSKGHKLMHQVKSWDTEYLPVSITALGSDAYPTYPRATSWGNSLQSTQGADLIPWLPW